ncbi:hypothetical protein CLV35_1618 [Motilibacter peucedani]|uniref:Glycosyl hydrolase family 43 n=1 Tax=Motilibacter peucedani TaxID=598650 RepID=A0A420XSP2_9ACTN|nr:hypothetical protein [Motilibacter peucedani]RKS77915.1 hypothetical protein CLV35_1618 [Motilibacter peucedani]
MLRLPTLTDAVTVVRPPSPGPGSWAGGPSAVVHEGEVHLAYRLRRPVGEGRGYRNVVARSRDGVQLETVAVLERDAFGGESLERPCLVRTPDGRWRLYVSVATPGTKHWRVDLLEAGTVEELATAPHRTVLPGSDEVAVKDPVVLHHAGRWHLWASVHPLESWDDADRMTTDYATSDDGVDWTWHGTVLAGRAGEWDARGVRVSSVALDGDRLVATYDGRATAAQNWEEVTGTATGELGSDGTFGRLHASTEPPLRSDSPTGGLRYLARVEVPEGLRWYYEVTTATGSHELRTELVGPSS